MHVTIPHSGLPDSDDSASDSGSQLRLLLCITPHKIRNAVDSRVSYTLGGGLTFLSATSILSRA